MANHPRPHMEAARLYWCKQEMSRAHIDASSASASFAGSAGLSGDDAKMMLEKAPQAFNLGAVIASASSSEDKPPRPLPKPKPKPKPKPARTKVDLNEDIRDSEVVETAQAYANRILIESSEAHKWAVKLKTLPLQSQLAQTLDAKSQSLQGCYERLDTMLRGGETEKQRYVQEIQQAKSDFNECIELSRQARSVLAASRKRPADDQSTCGD